MARREAVNTFTDGMISDLNPINTPNTVLTDCLNGTLITYDGNEYSLQNDKGNYPLKDCKLPANYIPVGIKEYANILYIVSYNPITKHVQIGSYPSPETIFDEFDYGGTDINWKKELTSNWTGENKNYSELDEKLELFYGPIPEQYFINPGDKYKVNINGISSESKLDLGNFEGIEFYILDDNRKPYNVSDVIKYNKYDFNYTGWKVPGYLATKLRFAEIDDFKVNVRKVLVPTYNSGGQTPLKELSLNFQFYVSDYLFNDHEEMSKSNLVVDIQFSNGRSETIPITNIIDLKNGSKCYYANKSWTDLTVDSSTITLTITPKVGKPKWSEELNKYITPDEYITYDKFTRILTFDLTQKGKVEDFTIGDDLWKYYVDDELTLYFNTGGVQETSVFSDEVSLYYSLYKAIGDTPTPITEYQSVPIDDWNVVGDSIIKLNFEPYDASHYNANTLYAEEYYIIQFDFKDPEKLNESLRTITKTILATELLNDYNSNRYDTVYFDEWFSNYENHIQNKTANVDLIIDNSTATSTGIQSDSIYSTWIAGGPISNYKTYIPSGLDGIDSSTGTPKFKISAGLYFNTRFDYSTDLKIPTGPLWKDFSSTINYTDISSDTISSITGKTDHEYISQTQPQSLTKSCEYRLMEQRSPQKLFSYTNNLIKVPVSPGDIKVEVDGIYEKGIDISDGPEPDIKINISGSSDTYVKQTSYVNNSVSKLKSKFEEYDVLFIVVKMPVQIQGDAANSASKNVLQFSCDDDDTVFARANTKLGSTTYYAVFKNYSNEGGSDRRSGTSKLIFIPVGNVHQVNEDSNLQTWERSYTSVLDSPSDALSRFQNNFSSKIKHIKGNGDSVIGKFYTAEESSSNNSSNQLTVNARITPSISINSWEYNTINIFSDNISSISKGDDNYFKRSPDRKLVKLSITLDSSETEKTFSGDISEINDLIDQEKNKISSHNTEVSNDVSRFWEDYDILPYLNDENVDKFVFVSATDNSNSQLLLNILNNEGTANTPCGFAAGDEYNPKGYPSGWYQQGIYMGYTQPGVII